MPEFSEQPTDETDAEIRRVCSLLESIAKQYPTNSAEYLALADAAEAFILVRQHQSLAKVYQQFKGARNGELTDEMIERLREFGIEPEDIEND